MSKIITDKEMGEIISRIAGSEIDDKDTYIKFLNDVASVITNYFGGTHGKATHSDDGLGYTVAFDVNECVPDDGGIFKDYDPDIKWKDNKEVG